MIEYRKHITRQMLRDEPEKLFVFGDNLERRGLGGQAREMRGEPNAIGIPTKRSPRMTEDAFFTDADLDTFQGETGSAFAKLAGHLRRGGTIVWPEDGIGTGLADLRRRAPKVWSNLGRAKAWLEDIDARMQKP